MEGPIWQVQGALLLVAGGHTAAQLYWIRWCLSTNKDVVTIFTDGV